MISEGEREGAFWASSLRLYKVFGVQQVLLRLQDEEGADIATILYILWRVTCGFRLDRAELIRLIELIHAWRDQVVWPLRTVQRAIKAMNEDFPGAAALRERVKGVELEAEYLLHTAMEAHSVDAQGKPEPSAACAAGAGLLAYSALIGFKLRDAECSLLVRSLDAGRTRS
ncbi:TIGR02444 family protein [Bradyrhizobium canariense]|uniref:TIGR02444 family protein n=1 Tax=Bradyrhizobium canariense TaxID=255045 RepID=A0A1H1VEC9_9BRAD|nr:TIGR02444 family protein [Bradyrhizobium canariense]SDS83148.1 TIGR02444 family protein [Bradyrhizobium canariense]